MLRIFGILWVCLVVVAACQEEEPVSPEPSSQEGCAGHNEAHCAPPCTVIKSRLPRSDDLEFMECVAIEIPGSAAITCALSPDQSECRIFPTTRVAIQWREAPCNHPQCSEADAGLVAADASIDASPDATSSSTPDSSVVADASQSDASDAAP